jgi:hypothetical protein
MAKQYSPPFAAEFQCDAYAVISCTRQYDQQTGGPFAIRATVFAFAAFAVLVSLARSSVKTAQDQAGIAKE